MPVLLADGEAEQNAVFNYYWPEAVEEDAHPACRDAH